LGFLKELVSINISFLRDCWKEAHNFMDSRRLLAWLLRLAGAFEILAFFAVVMPRSWMEVSHAWLGMGVMPDGPLIMFMIRQASYTYGMHGVTLWVHDAWRIKNMNSG